jgi:hypothetical protein
MEDIMKRITLIIAVMLLTIGAFAVTANAGVWETVKGWVGWQAVAYVLTAVLSLAAVGGSVLFIRIIQTLKEGGEFISVLAKALEDRKTTQEELKAIVKEGRDVFDVWKKTPDKYIVNG